MRISTGTLHVFTFKDGVLARFAHDLRLTLGSFELEIEGRDIQGSFDPRSLVVDGVVKGPRVDPKVLSEKDKSDILNNLAEHVLRWRQHPTVTYEGRLSEVRGGVLTIRGKLTLLGRTGPLDVTARRQGEVLRGEATLLQTRWGIQPFSALMGAIKIKNQVDVRFELPLPPSAEEAETPT